MFNQNLVLSGSRSEHVVRVPNKYRFVTVYNHSRHTITFFPGNTIDRERQLYQIPGLVYLTLPLLFDNQPDLQTRETIYTIVSEGINIATTQITLSFTTENNNINLAFPNHEILPINVNYHNSHSAINSWYLNLWSPLGAGIDTARIRDDRHQVITSFSLTVTDSALGTTDLVFSITPVSTPPVETEQVRYVIGAGAARGTTIQQTGLYIPVRFGRFSFESSLPGATARLLLNVNGFEYFPIP